MAIRNRWWVTLWALALAVASCSADGGSSRSSTNAGTGTSSGAGGGPVISVPDAGPSGFHPDGGGPCQNLQCKQIDCTGQGKAADATTVRGVVYDPAGLNPVYNAIVYIPNAPLKPFTNGVVCDKCGVITSGNPVVAALSDATGHFELRNVPAGAPLPLVVQVGKWRRQTMLDPIDACTERTITDKQLTRLPRNRGEGDLPQMALATGGCDAFECLLLKMGVDASEFTTEAGGGRVHVYRGLNGIGLFQSSAATALWEDVARMKKYDLIINSCECAEHAEEKTAAMVQNHADYVNAGGRAFDTHFNYYWINHGPAPMPSTATFAPGTLGPDPGTGTIDTSFPKGDAFANWLVAVGASTTKGQIPIADAKYDVASVTPPSTRWVFGSSSAGSNVFHYSFNTPVGAADDQQCGKVLFSDFHAAAGSNMQQVPFPMECNGNPFTAQEAALEWMLLDLSSCIQIETLPPPPPR